MIVNHVNDMIIYVNIIYANDMMNYVNVMIIHVNNMIIHVKMCQQYS